MIVLTSARAVLDEDPQGSEVTLDNGRHSNRQPDPDRFETTIDGRNVNPQRVPTSEASQVLHDRNQNIPSRDLSQHESRKHAPVNEHGLGFSNEQGQPQLFGLQDGLPPLRELDTNESSETQKEQKEIAKQEQEAEREFYNQYRNPIARLRAKYPQAPAEFLAVRYIAALLATGPD
jgi:aquaglyceroporin related protein